MEPVGKYKISQEARRSIDYFVSLYIGYRRNMVAQGSF